MLHLVRLARRQRILMFIGVPALLVFALAVVISCTSADTGSVPPPRLPSEELGSGVEKLGLTSLEERVAGSGIIALARMRSVSPGAEFYDWDGDGRTGYVSALEYRFEVLEYLKGRGGGEFVAVVYELAREYATRQEAIDRANDLLEGRGTSWDDRDAIVFLDYQDPALPNLQQSDQHAFSFIFLGAEYYTIASRYDRRWLPAASDVGSRDTSIRSSDRRFLLEEPSETSSTLGSSIRSSGGTGQPATITLAALKAKVAEIEQEVAAGGGSQDYRDCLYHKYKWEREVLGRKENLGGVYHRIREDESIASGLPAETQAYTSIDAPVALQEYGPTLPASNWGEFRVVGRNADVFRPRWPGVAVTARPLPAGTYQFHWAYRPPQYIICDAHPEDELKRHEVFVTVTAPAGTLHEAFFDPAAIGAAVGETGVSTSIDSLKWESGVATLDLSSAASLSGYDMDVIELDGSVSLTLSVAGAASNAGGTVTWNVADQPWHAGDQLMLRIRNAGPLPTATPTPTPTPEPTATPEPTPTPTPVPTAVAGVTVTLTPREEGNFTLTNVTIEWTDPDACDGTYFVAFYNNEELHTVVRMLGSHPAPATTTLSRELGTPWDTTLTSERWAGVICTTDWTVVGKASLASGLPSDSDDG